MTKFLVSFPRAAMRVSEEDRADVAEAAHKVVREAKAAGVYVFSGGIGLISASRRYGVLDAEHFAV